ncbi:hypothetical protein HY086_03865 [Candidatus Gottesmanbacteria bacterium]|nr:hypothetical protein [Candidatus Gottesmanbacteria bacterium]
MIKQLFAYLWQNRLWWLVPAVIVFIVFGVLITVASISPVSPFLYVLF